jgi:diacylglycerol kinase (ATP)
MKKYKNSSTYSSFIYAYRGIMVAVKSQKNFRLGFIISIVVILTAILIGFTPVEIAIIILTGFFVLFAELVNTVIEFIIDAYFGNKYSDIAKISKDIAAGTVLLAILNSAVIGLILFVPKIINFLTNIKSSGS